MKRRGGYTTIELVLVLMLLTFVAVSVFLLTDSGSAAYTRLSASRETASDLRIALSYIDVRLKKIDGNGSVRVQPAPFGGGQALVLAQRIEGSDYETMLYVDRGMLRELFVRKSLAVTADMASEIARADSLDVHFISDSLLALTLARGSTQPGAAGVSAATVATGSANAASPLDHAALWVYLRAGQGVTP